MGRLRMKDVLATINEMQARDKGSFAGVFLPAECEV